MGLDDKLDNKANDAAGTIKEGAGKMTGDRSLEGEGKLDQSKGKLGEAVENVKDAAKGAFSDDK